MNHNTVKLLELMLCFNSSNSSSAVVTSDYSASYSSKLYIWVLIKSTPQTEIIYVATGIDITNRRRFHNIQHNLFQIIFLSMRGYVMFLLSVQ